MRCVHLLVLLLLVAPALFVHAGHIFAFTPSPGVVSEGSLWSPNLYWRLQNSNKCGPIVVGQLGELGWWLTGDDKAYNPPINQTFWSLTITNPISYNMNLNPMGWVPGIFMARGSQAEFLTNNEMLSQYCQAVNAVGVYTRWFFKGAYSLAISNSGVLMRRNVYGNWEAITDHMAWVFFGANGVQINPGTSSGVQWRASSDWFNVAGTDTLSPNFNLTVLTSVCTTNWQSSLLDQVKNWSKKPVTYRRQVALTRSQSTSVAQTDIDTTTTSWSLSFNFDAMMTSRTFTVFGSFMRQTTQTVVNTKDFSRVDSSEYEVDVPPQSVMSIYSDVGYQTCEYQSTLGWTYCSNLFAGRCYTLPMGLPLSVTTTETVIRIQS